MNWFFLTANQQSREKFTEELFRISSLIIIFISLLHIVAASNFLVLFADGAYYLFEVINGKTFVFIEPTSRTVQFLQQLPVILSLQLGWNDLEKLMIVAGFANLFLPLILTTSCYFILPNKQKAFFIFPLIHYLAGSLASWFPTVTDAPPATAYFWMLFYMILFRSSTRLSVFLCILIAVPALYLHEAMSFLAPFLIVASWWRYKNESDHFLKSIFLILSGWFLLTIYIQFKAILYPRHLSNRSGFLSQFLEFQWIYWDGINIAVVLSTLMAIIFLLIFISNLYHSGRDLPKAMLIARQVAFFLFVIVSLSVPAILLFDIHYYGIITQFAARAHAAFVTIPLAVIVLVSVFKPSIQKAWQDRLYIILILFLAFGILSSHGIGLSKWSNYIQDFRTLLQYQVGLIPFDIAIDTLPPGRRQNFKQLSWTWTNPTISYLLSSQGRISTIVANPQAVHWQPFEPCNPLDLLKGRFDIKPYLEAITLKTNCSNLAKGIDFTQSSYPTFIAAAKGLSAQEFWGRWSNGKMVGFKFKQTLPVHFTLILTAQAFGPNINAPITVKIGNVEQNLQLTADPHEYQLIFETASPVDLIEFLIPYPTSPAELGQSNDFRKLGIGFINLRIETDSQ